MSRILARLKIAAFVLVVAAPLVVLLLVGSVPPYGQRPHPKFPSGHALVNGKRGAFDQLGQALLDRSAVTKEAIRLKYVLNYDVSHYVDTDLVVSGRDDWLFYKEDFAKQFVCVDEARMRRDLAQVDVMTDLAAVTELRMFVSLSPDKSSIYPEFLHPLARKYWGCKGESAAALRRVMAEEAPRMIDHSVPLLAEKARDNAGNLFFHQDTHWSPFGAALALRQLFAAVAPAPAAPVPAPRLSGEQVIRETDMGNLMLLLPEREKYEGIDPAVENQMIALYAAHPLPRTILLHDSFYTVAPFSSPAVFPGLQTFHIDITDDAMIPAITHAETLIVNSVERSFLGRVESGGLHWSSSLARALLTRNNIVAAGLCSNFGPVVVEPRAAYGVVTVPPRAAGERTCVRLTVDRPAPTNIGIALPRRSGGGYVSDFAPGRVINMTLPAGRQSVALLMPEYVSGRILGIQDGAGAPSVELGVLVLPRD